ncbi:[FeFe] hydrogenase H-cluster maturation GTPase HydF [Fusibacter sp. 3D3]|uniref:[FeFe] hydrogenase H-cluster maturation GTPase HydF n=1 Tax=Fusibacter sp. 3D3 TaxID=1048380 RepID=UPI0008534A67|nr:[FeFe] hydrogenase H-cluster maturation GTPase HydF [Fusibacter sp. 3D3]GAU77215.1 FeFe-hydrogenase maturation GTPase HydF [Fusibacter sp. 3D3]
MNKTPHANRFHIGIYGNRNAGKSSLFNAIIGQDIAVVSEVEGTTTDPVFKAMELIPFGPVVFIDTAGLDDEGLLGDLRVEKSKKMLSRTDFAIYLVDGAAPDVQEYKAMTGTFKKYGIPFMCVVNKADLLNEIQKQAIRSNFGDVTFVSTQVMTDIHELNQKLMSQLTKIEEEPVIVGDLLPYGSTVVLVVPIDSEAPKGRIILPQVQLIRDCLDHGIKSYVVRDTELEVALKELPKVDLVVTDSQAFGAVSKIVPEHIKLTSFSILFARQKGDIKSLIEGVDAFKALKPNAKILISESCTHNHSHEDIGRVKIPNLIRNKISDQVEITFSMGHDFPENPNAFDLIIHCGACMMNRKSMQTRIDLCENQKVYITNYGLALAYFNGILERSVEILNL